MSRPEQVYDALRKWLDGPSALEEAIRRTVEDGVFPEEDIQFAVSHLRESLTIDVLERWLSDPERGPSRAPLKILCLHAGNLPLVGLQDVVAVLLSGNRYFGKLSRKDPWLIASFVDVCREMGLPEADGCSTELDSFSGLQADAVLFTGSAKSVPPVMDELLRLEAVKIKPPTNYLIRTAQLSVAFVRKQQSAGELLEAITRYNGRGCRSVGVVVSPYPLDEYAGALRLAEAGRNEKYSVPEPGAENDEIGHVPVSVAGSDENDLVPESEAGQLSKKINGPKKYLHAYAMAAELPCLQLLDGRWLFIESDDTGLMREGVVLWIRGGEVELDIIRNRLSGRIQSIFTDEADLDGGAEVADKAEMADDDTEYLRKAQRPEFDWCPDGVDTLKWLMEGFAGTE